ncbi:PREDICTED: uncharacterized protein LOC109585220 [Amphimedon queenslandica]|uniref:Death domain-containing protein n=2 Tax=Amphimedon queenslandica TaxID=400682 RepID=A0AAN0JJB8_AMPQE|nr:PREDICTED: uncharacterized protein LOC109585220 [Amphimedon queenslandica]|eukprot:XP_019856773.1 PREDICTED: uncharacterized protein LOC109585220 [Amphimedon queenslandica]
MVDLCQWRASIGLWNCSQTRCQTTSTLSKPSNRNCFHSFSFLKPLQKAPFNLPLKVYFFAAVLLLLLLPIFYLSSYVKLESHSGYHYTSGTCITVHCHSIQAPVCCTTLSYMYTYIQPPVLAEDTIDSLRLFYQLVFFLLLLSGDVEINPGPKIDDQPSVPLLLELLKPLVDWKLFGLHLPGMTLDIIETIEESENDINLQKEKLFREWLIKNANTTWKDVISALKRRKEFELVDLINNLLESQEYSGNEDTVPVTPSSSVSAVNAGTMPISCAKEGNTPSAILRMNYATLVDAITSCLYRVTHELYAKELIPMETINHIQTAKGISDLRKTGQLVSVIQRQLECSYDPRQYLIDTCHVLMNQRHKSLVDIATSILLKLKVHVHVGE